MKMLAVVLSMAILAACGPREPRDSEKSNAAQVISYFQDKRTGLCFAFIVSNTDKGYTVGSIASAPCEPPRSAGLLK